MVKVRQLSNLRDEVFEDVEVLDMFLKADLEVFSPGNLQLQMCTKPPGVESSLRTFSGV